MGSGISRVALAEQAMSLERHAGRGGMAYRTLKLTGLLTLLVASTGSIAAQTTSDEQELRRLEDNWCLALKTRSEALLGEILAEDYVEVTSSGGIESRAQALAALRDPNGSTTSCGNSNLKVRVYGDAAVVTGIMDQAGTSHGVPFSGKRLVFTDTYVRRGGRWQCVAGQSTAMVGPK